MEQKINRFHFYQVLNGLLLAVIIGLLFYALFSMKKKKTEDVLPETTQEVVQASIDETVEEILPEEAPSIQERKDQTLQEAILEQQEKEAHQPISYETITIEETEKAEIPVLDFSQQKLEETTHRGDLRIRGVDCSALAKNFRVEGDLHISGTGVERCWLPSGLSVLGSVYVKQIKSIIFPDNLRVQKKIYLLDDICVSVPLKSAENVILSDGVETCQ